MKSVLFVTFSCFAAFAVSGFAGYNYGVYILTDTRREAVQRRGLPPPHSHGAMIHTAPRKNANRSSTDGGSDTLETVVAAAEAEGVLSPGNRAKLRTALNGKFDLSSATVKRWVDPEGMNTFSWFGLWETDHTGANLRAKIDAQEQRIELYGILTDFNPANDWLLTADFFANLENIPGDVHARMLDGIMENWLEENSPEAAEIWLRDHDGDGIYDLARGTLALSLPLDRAQHVVQGIVDAKYRARVMTALRGIRR